MNRRHFLRGSVIGGSTLLVSTSLLGQNRKKPVFINHMSSTSPIAISTWNNIEASQTAGQYLEEGHDALSSAIEGVAIEEADVTNTTVGKGGAPDRTGNVTLDSCVMDANGNCGSVMAVENIVHVASLARDVMEKTPHVILTGRGARKFALEQGYTAVNLLTNESREQWINWLKTAEYKPIVNVENHDTIGMLCLDKAGNLSGACTTSGLAYKMEGRVGDSPIIGSGLFVDNNIGAAVATGVGEEVIKTVGSFLIVELMRQGYTPQQACQTAIERIIENRTDIKFQVAYLALNKKGEIGSYSIQSGFSYTIYKDKQTRNINSTSFQEKILNANN